MGRKFRAFLHGRAWTHAEGPVALFNHAVAWLCGHRVLLPGVSVLARQVAEVRTVEEKRLHAAVASAARRADPALPAELAELLVVPEGARYLHLEVLRRPPTGTALARALHRVNEIAAFQLGRVNLSRVPVNPAAEDHSWTGNRPAAAMCTLTSPTAARTWSSPRGPSRVR
ncbi:DUF4158 domain-containing protein [Streptomyces sp. ISL-99]|nr:DUF4158 domain-containing protein [Streptomyces sp. ISL-99]MBT2529736.1 DUF4158 domain-containing protein [Streptomyces sp. ISL-99]